MAATCVWLSVIGQAVKRVPAKKFIEHYEQALQSAGRRTRKTSTKKGSSTRTAKKTAGKSRSKRTT